MGSTVRTMALVTVVRSLGTNKIVRQTNILLKIFLCFDIFFIVSFIVQLVWLSSYFLRGFCFTGFLSASLLCNSLAIVGVRRWNQWYVLPWLFVYTAFKIFLIACLSTRFFTNPSIS